MAKCLLDIKLDITDAVRNEALKLGGFREYLNDTLEITDAKQASITARDINSAYKEQIITPSMTSKNHYFISPSNELSEKYLAKANQVVADNGAAKLNQEEKERGGYTEEERGEFFQTEDVAASKASPKTVALVKDLLNRIGVKVETLQNVKVNGIKRDINGVADIMQKLVQVAEGKENVALTEEAMHFVVEIIEQKDPQLFNKLLKEINSYRVLNQVIADYGQLKQYQTADGKPDIRKLKKEAIGKILSEVVIDKFEGATERPELLAKVESWWQSIINVIKSIFLKSGFDTAAMKVLAGDIGGTVEDIRDAEGSFLQQQKSTQDAIIDKIKLTSASISKDDDGYKINGVKIKNRVTDIVKDWYSRRFADKDLTKSEYQIAVDELKAEKGTAGHADIEHMLKSYFLNEDGTVKSVDQRPDDSAYVSQINPANRDIYDILKRNMAARLESFPVGTKFLSETVVYDAKRDLAGTIDFVAITPEGKVSVLDWKFMDLNVDKYQDIPWYKVNAWRQQMKQYKLILQNVYGVKPEDFEQTRMIPIRAKYSKGSAKEGVLPTLTGVEIGNINVKKEELAYLLPVGLEQEKTGKPKIDALIEKLNKIYDTISSKKATPEQKRGKAEQLNALYSAIRQLQVRENIKPLLNQAKLLNAEVENIIADYEKNWKGKDAKSFTQEQKDDFADRILSYETSLMVYTSLATDLKSLFRGDLSEEDRSTWDDIRNTTENANELESDLEDVRKDFAENVIAKSVNVLDFLKPEKVIKGFTKWFSSTSTLQLKGTEILYKLANEAFAKASMDTIDEAKKLETFKKAYDSWAKGKGFTFKNYFDVIKKKGNNELIDEFNPEFYKELKSRISDKDHAWIIKNIDVAKYNEFLKEQKEKEYQRIEDKARFGTEEEIIREKKLEKLNIDKLYNTSTSDAPGWLLYDFVKKFPKRETWESKEWRELNNPANKPALDFYNYIKERNQYYEQIGYINKADARVFLPFVRKSLMEKIVMGGDIKAGQELLRAITVSEGDVGYGQIDPITKEPVYNIPKYFTRETGEEVSEDLFRNMTLLNQMAIRYDYLNNIENQLKLVIRTEANKDAIKTSYFGKTKYKADGDIETTSDNTENTQLVRDMMEAIVYGHKYVESENFDQLLIGIGGLGKRLNAKLGYKVFPEEFDNSQISLNKTITQLNNFFQIKTLGLNPISALSNFLGGSFQSYINAGTYFKKEEFMSNEFKIAGKMRGVDAKKYIGLLEYFLPLTENYNMIMAKNLSLSKLSQEGVQDFLMSLMRNSDQYVQTVNFFSYLDNSIVEDGKVVNAREMLRATPEYANIYNVSPEERKALEKKFEEDVKKLVAEKGVMKLAEVKGNELVIPGLERKSDSVIELRRKVQSLTKDALGNLTEDDLRKINLNIYGKSFMIFKNWIPRLVDVRAGNLKYNTATDAYEWGRTRMMARVITDDLTGSIDSLISSIKGDDQPFVDQMKKLYEAKKADYEKETGKTLNMTEKQFIDLVRKNITNQMTDVLFYLGLTMLFIGAKAIAPDKDDDKATVNRYRFMLRVIDKVRDEIAYFYDPTSILGLTSSGIFPSLSYLDNFKKLFKNFMTEMYAIGVGDEKLEKSNQVVKYGLKGFPVTSQFDTMLLLFFPDVAKDLGMKAQSESRPIGR